MSDGLGKLDGGWANHKARDLSTTQSFDDFGRDLGNLFSEQESRNA
jgi:hypothetical protein